LEKFFYTRPTIATLIEHIPYISMSNEITKGERMTTETNSSEQEGRKSKRMYRSGGSDAIYGFGLIGAWVYYVSHATTFWMGALGLLKGIVWPAMLVYELMKFLEM
jgi:hypothetical protein